MPARPLLRLRTHGRVVAEPGVVLGRGIRWDVAPGASVVLGDGCSIGPRCRFHVASGAVVVVGAGARLGARCVVTAHERVDVGPQARLGDEVVLLDFDHVVADAERPGAPSGPRHGRRADRPRRAPRHLPRWSCGASPSGRAPASASARS